jgi:hypothetical protein
MHTCTHPLIAAQDGLATSKQLASLGWPNSTIAYRCTPGGPWQRVLPRVILLQTGAPTPRQRLRAALLYAGEDALLTGTAALALYGVRAAGLLMRVGAVDVLVPGTRNPRSRAYVRSTEPHALTDAFRWRACPAPPCQEPPLTRSLPWPARTR